ncbi:MAG TPA: copper amine oxidase N-terminal domain-containing protein [Symbiobacteriaceae bacterium]|nr:copper amine oxidase N-terminal domain-containing protein [Symbiobacteriaceae bacterium]
MNWMRRIFVAVVFLGGLLVISPATAEAPIEVWVDGKPVAMDVAPVVINGRTMVPARFVAEALGASVEWDQAKQRVVITSKGMAASIQPVVQGANSDGFVQLSVVAATHKVSVTVVDKVTGAIRIDGQGHFAIFPARDTPDYVAVSDNGVLVHGRIVNGITLVDPADLAAAGIIPSAANP